MKNKYPPRAYELIAEALKQVEIADAEHVCWEIEKIGELRRGKRDFDDWLDRRGINTFSDVKAIMDNPMSGGDK